MTHSLPTIRLHNMDFAKVTAQEAVDFVMSQLAIKNGGWMITANLDILRQYGIDSNAERVCKAATIIVADGMPLIWASRLQGTPLPGRVAGSDLISSLSAAAAAGHRSIYLIGGSEGAAERAAAVLQTRYAGLDVRGFFCPPFHFENDPSMIQSIAEKTVEASPDIVFVGLGFPKQELLIEKIRDRLPLSWWIGVGISFSFLCGDVKRAPRILQFMGLEWAHRVAQEPRRLAKRYLIHGMPFALKLLGSACFNRLHRLTT